VQHFCAQLAVSWLEFFLEPPKPQTPQNTPIAEAWINKIIDGKSFGPHDKECLSDFVDNLVNRETGDHFYGVSKSGGGKHSMCPPDFGGLSCAVQKASRAEVVSGLTDQETVRSKSSSAQPHSHSA